MSVIVLLLGFFIIPSVYSKAAEPFINPMRHDILLATGKTFDSILNRQRNALGVTVLLHFDSKRLEHRTFIESVYNPVAKKLKGMVRFTAVDCSEWTQFCTETLNPKLEYPTVVVYSPNRLLPPHVFAPTPDQKQITSVALNYVPGDHVQTITRETLDSFITQHIAVPKIILFSSKETPSVLYKALSNTFADRVLFGFVLPKENSFEKRYDIVKRPTIISIRANIKKPDVFKGKLSYTELHDWINVYAETFVKGGGFSADENSVEASPKPWLVQKVPEITGLSHQDVCFRSTSSLCIIYLSDGKPSDEEMRVLETLADEYPDSVERGAKFRWGWLDVSTESGFAELFEVKSGKLPSLVALNPHKRLRYIRLAPEKIADKPAIKDLLEKIISGDGRFTLLKGQKLPAFAARTKIADSTKKEEL